MSTADATPGRSGASSDADLALDQFDFSDPEEREIRLLPTLRDLALISLISVPIQLVATDLTVLEIVIGLLVLYGMCVIGVLLTKYLPVNLPSVAWISLVAILFTLPMLPWSGLILSLVEGIDFLALAVPPLAYAGLAISNLEIQVMRRSGWKLLIVAVFVFLGTYVGSAVIAEVTLRLSGGAQ